MKKIDFCLALFLAVTTVLIGPGLCVGKSTKDAQRPLQWQFQYDDENRIAGVVDPAGRKTKIHYELDAKKRIKKVEKIFFDSSKVVFEYDRFGRRVGMNDPAGRVRYTYDDSNRLTGVHRKGSPSVSYTFDTMDRLKSVSAGKEFNTRYSYDYLGRLEKMDTPAGTIFYEYQTGQGAIIRNLPNGIRTIWEFGPGGNLQSITHVSSDNRILAQFTYTYRPDGLISEIKELSQQGTSILTYEYDRVQRLRAVTDSKGKKIEYKHDKVGNRTELRINGQKIASSIYDWAGRMVKNNGQECSNDGVGNITSCVGKDGKRVFEFNAMNLLKAASMGEARVEYQYDGDGYLIARTAGGKRTSFVPDPQTDIWRPLLATDESGKQTFYIWEGEIPLGAIVDGKVVFFLHDHLGSVRLVTDNYGQITSRYDYSPFGVPWREFEDSSLQPGFGGLFYDEATALYLTRARAYNPNLGRFLQQDPQRRIPDGSQKNIAPYVYCGSDPINYLDQEGLEPKSWLTKQTERFLSPFRLKGREVEVYQKWVSDYNKMSEQITGEQHPSTFSPLYWLKAKLFVGANEPGRMDNLNRNMRAYLNPFERAERMADLAANPTPENYQKMREYELSAARGGLAVSAIVGTAEGLYKAGSMMAGAAHEAVVGFSGYLTGMIPGQGGVLTNDLFLEDMRSKLGNLREKERLAFQGDDDRRKYYPGGGGPGGPGGGPGGLSSGPGGSAGLFSPMSPSNVGGIYLRGAGEALKALGTLKGIAVDEKNGRLVLISEGERKVDLPPLRMDDVVTIFRSVYKYGEAPFVSIDPDPKDPQGPIMQIRHGKGTADTYVGWVLFEADRVMKGYSLGYDNVTRAELKSKIADYQNLFDLGFSNFDDKQKDPAWERFWIVPAKVNRGQTTDTKLTIFDVPLRVNTQRMELKDGKLVPARDDTPSKEAKKFSEWFTKRYDQIASEALYQPPAGSGIDSSVAIYGELRRIALITAIAETLRDQGVPFPSWMRGYKVKPCPMPPDTPSIVVEASETKTEQVRKGDSSGLLETTHKQRIYGGVNLAPADKDVHTVKGASEANKLAPKLWKKVMNAPVLSPVSFNKDGKQYHAVALPGNDTRDLGACRLIETDLEVPVQRGSRIVITRKFNSFFQPRDVLGSGWTFDFPRLEMQPEPVRRSNGKTEYKTGYQLTSPLNTYSESFRQVKFVPEMNGKLLVPGRHGIFLGMAEKNHDKIGFPTKVLVFRDGRRWHFDDSGNLVAQIQDPLTVIYRRNEANRIRRIEGWYGKELRADIQLHYDKHGNLTSARGSNNKEVSYKYQYSSPGVLTQVKGPEAEAEYEYKNGLVTAVATNGKDVRRFEYDDNGRLLSEQQADGTKITYAVSSGSEGAKKITASTNKNKRPESVEYDAAFRPLNRIFENGTQVQWQYDQSDAVTATIKQTQGEQHIVTRSADGGQMTWRLPEGRTYSTKYDKAGRMTAFWESDKLIMEQKWAQTGQLASAWYENVVFHPEYREDGVCKGVLVTPPGKGPQFSRWLHIEYDEIGHPQEISDYTGSNTKIGYDQTGRLGVMVTNRGKVRLTHDPEGRVKTIETSWDYNQSNNYDPKTGDLLEAKFTIGKEEAAIRFEQGRLSKVKQFDGGETDISYYGKGIHKGLMKQVRTPNDLLLRYEYDRNKRIAGVNCGGEYRLDFGYDGKGRLCRLSQAPARP